MFRRFAPLALLALTVCNNEANSVDGYLDSIDGFFATACECDHDNVILLALILRPPYDSPEECREDLGVDSSERGCVEGLFTDEATDYRGVTDCRAAANERAASCLSSKTCTDTARADCYEQLADEVEDCPTLPDDLNDRLNDCLYN
jgi:hypothetical protein